MSRRCDFRERETEQRSSGVGFGGLFKWSVIIALLFSALAPAPSAAANTDDYELILITDPKSPCRDTQDGIVRIGNDVEARLILAVGPELASKLEEPLAFKAEVGGRKLDFSRIGQREFVAKIQVNSLLEQGIGPDNIDVSLFALTGPKRTEVPLRGGLKLKIMSEPPRPASNLRLIERHRGRFILQWDPSPDILNGTYSVQKWEKTEWGTVAEGLESPRATVAMRPNGRFRVASTDCASHVSFSDEIVLDDTFIVFSKEGCSGTKDLAYIAAESKIRDAFVKEACDILLELDSSLSRAATARAVKRAMRGDQPGIGVTPFTAAEFKRGINGWCVTVTGKAKRDEFIRWCKRMKR